MVGAGARGASGGQNNPARLFQAEQRTTELEEQVAMTLACTFAVPLLREKKGVGVD